MFLRNAKVNLSSLLANLQKARSEILIVGDKNEKLVANRNRRKLEELIIFFRNGGSALDQLIMRVPSKEEVEEKKQREENQKNESRKRWTMKWQLE